MKGKRLNFRDRNSYINKLTLQKNLYFIRDKLYLEYRFLYTISPRVSTWKCNYYKLKEH